MFLNFLAQVHVGSLHGELRLAALANQNSETQIVGIGTRCCGLTCRHPRHDGDNSSAKAPNPHAPPLENRSVSRNLPRKAAQIISAPGHLGALALLPAICYPRGQQTKQRACDRCRHCSDSIARRRDGRMRWPRDDPPSSPEPDD